MQSVHAIGRVEDEKLLHNGGQGIHTTQIWSLVEIAAMARQREVVDVVGAAMLSGNHMLDMMQQFTMILVQPAIFAPLSRSLAHEPSGCGIDHCREIWSRRRRALSLRIAMKSAALISASYSERSEELRLPSFAR